MDKICELTKKEYDKLIATGMFFELYPECTGIYKEDWKLSKNGKLQIECKKLKNEI